MWHVQSEGVKNWPLSYHSGMDRPIVIKFDMFRDHAAIHITQVMDEIPTSARAHAHLRAVRILHGMVCH